MKKLEQLDSFQQAQLDKLRTSEVYREASMFTVLYDLMSSMSGDKQDAKDELIAIIDTMLV